MERQTWKTDFKTSIALVESGVFWGNQKKKKLKKFFTAKKFSTHKKFPTFLEFSNISRTNP